MHEFPGAQPGTPALACTTNLFTALGGQMHVGFTTGTGWTCTQTGQQLDCSMAGLASGAQSQLIVQTSVPQYGIFSVVGNLVSDLPDSNSADNRNISATFAAVALVPTTSTPGLVLLILLLAGMAAYRVNQRKAA